MTAPDQEPAEPRSSPLRYLLPLLALAWLVSVPLLGLEALGQSLTFFGEQVTQAQLRATDHGLGVAAGVALGLSVLGIALSVRTRSRAGAVVFCLLLLLSFGVAAIAGLFSLAHREVDPAPPAATHAGACQEHSGGDTRCPGG